MRGEKASLETRLEAANPAIEEINTPASAVEDEKSNKTRNQHLKDWTVRRNDIDSQLQLVNFQLNEKLARDESSSAVFVEAIKSSIAGSGLNLLLAILAFVGTFLFFRYASHLLSKVIKRDQNKERRFTTPPNCKQLCKNKLIYHYFPRSP